MTELCELAVKHGTDKCVYYTPFYHDLLKDRRDIKKVLEFGVGDLEDIRHSLSRVGMVPIKVGPSLFMWQDYFPQAQIYALDHDPKKFINEGRIQTFYCDQGDPDSYTEAIKHIGYDFDFIIEDGSHHALHQILSLQMLMPLLKRNGIYIMEDTGWGPVKQILEALSPYDYHIEHFHRADFPPTEAASCVVVRHKHHA